MRVGSSSRVSPCAAIAVWAAVLAVVPIVLDAHGMTGKNATFVEGIQGPAVGPFLYLGAKHMVTGYDHLLFLVGVIFFLYRLKDVALYVHQNPGQDSEDMVSLTGTSTTRPVVLTDGPTKPTWAQ